jgi:O-antigen ligase
VSSQVERRDSSRSGSLLYWREAALAALVLGSVLAVGSVHVPTAIAVALASGALASALLWDSELPPTALVPCAVTLGLAAFSAAQALPLPRGLVAFIASDAARVWERSLEPLGGAPGWISVSLDPGATLVESAKWAGYSAMLAAAAVVARRRGALLVLATVLAAGLVTALIASAHLALGATHLYGLYEPKLAVTPWGVAPILNPNNFAGYLNFAAFIGFGLMLGRRPVVHPALFALGIAFLLAVSLLTGSRGGVASLAVGFVLLAFAFGRLQKSRGWSSRTFAKLFGPVALVVVVALAFVALGSGRGMSLGFSQESYEKLSISRWAMPMIVDHPWFGVGRGAFETTFPAYRQGMGRMMFQYPENLVVQWLSEWGIVVGLAALGLFAWCFRPGRYRFSDDLRRQSAFIGLLVLIAHNLVDLSLEVSGVATSFFAVLGALSGAADRSSQSAPDEAARYRQAAWVPAATVAALSTLALMFGRHPVLAERMELHAAYRATEPHESGASKALLQRVGEAIRRHPGDPYLPYLAGVLQARLGNDPVPWLNRAIERDPRRGQPYYMLAQLLFARGMLDQAWLHARLAVERQPELGASLAATAVARTTKMEHVLGGIPEGEPGLSFLLSLAREAKRGGRGELTEQALLQEAARRYPRASQPRLFEAGALATALELSEGGECEKEARAACVRRLAESLKKLEGVAATTIEATLLRARYLVLVNRAPEADDLLTRRCPELDAPIHCWRTRVAVAAKTRDPGRLDAATTAYLSMACDNPEACGKATLAVGDLLAKEEDWLGAMKYYADAAREHPTRAAWKRLARAAKEAGHPLRAREADRRSQHGLGGPE